MANDQTNVIDRFSSILERRIIHLPFCSQTTVEQQNSSLLPPSPHYLKQSMGSLL